MIACSLTLLIRCYWTQDLWSIESYVVSVITIMLLAVSLITLWTGHKTDPGFLKEHSGDMDNQLCKRCALPRPDELTHHCSACDKCVMNMDHHCYFMDNCIGKNTLKYFIQYTFWVTVSMSWGAYFYCSSFYNQNVTGGGFTSVFDIRPDIFVLNLLKIVSMHWIFNLNLDLTKMTIEDSQAINANFLW